MKFRYSSAIILGLLMCVRSSCQPPAEYKGAEYKVAEEYKVKAAFLYNFPKFVEWPAQSFKSPADPIVIGVLGRNPFRDALIEALAGKTINGRAFQVREISDASQVSGCHMLFVSASEHKHRMELFKEIAIAGVLTIGETANFAEDGGVVNFKIEGGNVRLQINLEAARRQQLHISAKLLSLAEIVGK